MVVARRGVHYLESFMSVRTYMLMKIQLDLI